jgi:hypothetical protein
MDKQTELQEGFVKAVRVLCKYHSFFDATITALEEEQFTCTVTTIDDNSTFYNVPFGVLTNSFSTIRLVPEVGSACVLAFREAEQSRPELIKVDKITQLIFFDGTVGVPLTPKTVKQLNNIENKINALIAAFNAWTPVSGDGGAALKSSLISWVSQSLTPTQNNDIANTKILQ